MRPLVPCPFQVGIPDRPDDTNPFRPRIGAAFGPSGSDDPTREQTMANTPSAKKAARKIERRTAVNKDRRSRVRTFLRKVEEAILTGDKEAAQQAFKAAEPELMRAASKGVYHKNTASRKISRLSNRVKAVGTAA
ncbi:ribosomal protein S20 [Aureimonas pseudogalii]|uniref:Small ribosomal subunit protein bS20 n=2 Tax=Aureimonas pseudogalii TaxID=1744844 RepID=A0A7W6EAN8_9HYPH|nr:ribosomal protein S20 [Aureimonas pseudogalii]